MLNETIDKLDGWKNIIAGGMLMICGMLIMFYLNAQIPFGKEMIVAGAFLIGGKLNILGKVTDKLK